MLSSENLSSTMTSELYSKHDYLHFSKKETKMLCHTLTCRNNFAVTIYIISGRPSVGRPTCADHHPCWTEPEQSMRCSSFGSFCRILRRADDVRKRRTNTFGNCGGSISVRPCKQQSPNGSWIHVNRGSGQLRNECTRLWNDPSSSRSCQSWQRACT